MDRFDTLTDWLNDLSLNGFDEPLSVMEDGCGEYVSLFPPVTEADLACCSELTLEDIGLVPVFCQSDTGFMDSSLIPQAEAEAMRTQAEAETSE